VTIPPIEQKEEPGETEMLHRFVRRGEPSMLRLRLLLEDEQPRANQPYVLEIDGQRFEGTTDVNGKLQAPMPGNARRARLVVGPDDAAYDLQLGHMEPVDSIRGIQHRLKNLGYAPGPIDGQFGPQTHAALTCFQQDRELEETGEADQPTRAALLEAHGH
jgi:N-acetylmuramoyl-L-alanine amidase